MSVEPAHNSKNCKEPQQKDFVRHTPFAQVLSDYQNLEPGETDSWNPLFDDLQLFQRLTIFRELTLALRLIKADPSKIKVLDAGCGTGRSCRMYLDLGFMPSQITGIDIREGAVTLAGKIHPAIKVLLYDGVSIPFPDNHFDWVSLCTVMSSIKCEIERRILAKEICRVLRPGGYLFYWDLMRANVFAGADELIPYKLFAELTACNGRNVCLYGQLDDILLPGRAKRFIKLLLRRYIKRATHHSAVFCKSIK